MCSSGNFSHKSPEGAFKANTPLEKYLEDHFLDNDARLVLAANYLFGGRPEAAAELLESAFSLEIKQSAPGQLLLESARSLIEAGPLLVPSEND